VEQRSDGSEQGTTNANAHVPETKKTTLTAPVHRCLELEPKNQMSNSTSCASNTNSTGNATHDNFLDTDKDIGDYFRNS
jgi:hypothetical protein